MRYSFILLAALILSASTATAQRKRAKKGKAKVEVVQEDPRFVEMLQSTAQITIIDSLVVDSAKVANYIYANPEEGRINTYANFFNKKGEGFMFVNELGDKCIYAKLDTQTGHKLLYQSDLLADGWTTGTPLEGLDNHGRLTDFDCPYLMTDGVTLYFAAKGSDGLGGYDIYRTRLDTDNGKFLTPENLGLPFNSDADDYFYVVDEQNQVAYFVSNRRQPQGKTCVYTFIPSETRKVLNTEAYSDSDLRSLARIERIADTQSNPTLVKQALARKAIAIEKAREASLKFIASDNSISFVINDQVTYNSINDFRDPYNRQRMNEVLSLRKQQADMEAALEKARNYFATASSIERNQLRPEIKKSEQQIEMLRDRIHLLEKTIRNTENE